MNRIHPKKLLQSKWTAVKPVNREKHFMVTEVEYDEDGLVLECVIEAVLTRRPASISWRDLQNTEQWVPGWK